jgi:hypothetical protein
MAKDKGTPVVHVSHGDVSLDRDSITVSCSDIPVRFYRTNAPTIFAGLQIVWLEGTDAATGAEVEMSSGAGLGSKYLTLSVRVPGHPTVYEYVDMDEVLQARASAIITEVTAQDRSTIDE